MTARAALLSAATLALVWLCTGNAFAQTASPTAAASGTQDCADFDTQEEAQVFYDAHVNDTPGNPDPFDLDTDGDGKACEGLPTSASASPSTSAAPVATATPAATSGSLGNTGAETGVLAMSGLTLLELGYGLTLASRRLGVRRRAIPLYLVRKFAHAARKGDGHVQVAEDMYLVHRSVLESQTSTKTLAPVAEERDEDADAYDAELFDVERDGSPMVTAGEYPNVYAALANPTAVRRDR